MAYHYLTHPASPVDGVDDYLPGFLAKRQLPFFAKKSGQVRMIMIIIAMRSGKPLR
jgi:hypothetical protein